MKLFIFFWLKKYLFDRKAYPPQFWDRQEFNKPQDRTILSKRAKEGDAVVTKQVFKSLSKSAITSIISHH